MAVWPCHGGTKGSGGADHEKARLHFAPPSAFLISASPSGAGLLAGFVCPGEIAHLMQRDLHSPFPSRVV